MISRTSSFSFKGKNEDVRNIARQLGVAHVLEGSVRKSGNTVRITAQLIKSSDGSHLWSETYDRSLDDIFAVQDEIAREVVAALRVRLLNKTPARPVADVNPEMHNLLLLARYHRVRRTAEGFRKAGEYVEQGLAIDSTYAPLWVELARLKLSEASLTPNPAPLVSEARRAAAHAVKLDPNLAGGYVVLALVALTYDWDWEAGAMNIEKAVQLAPNEYEVLSARGGLASRMGDNAKALKIYRSMIVRDPLRPNGYSLIAGILVAMDSAAAAESWARKGLEVEPSAPAGHTRVAETLLLQNRLPEALEEAKQEKTEWLRDYMLSMIYDAMGRRAEADAALRMLEAENPDGAAFQIAEIHAHRGDADNAFKWLEHAYRVHDPGLAGIKRSVPLRQLRKDPRFHAMLRKMRLPV